MRAESVYLLAGGGVLVFCIAVLRGSWRIWLTGYLLLALALIAALITRTGS